MLANESLSASDGGRNSLVIGCIVLQDELARVFVNLFDSKHLLYQLLWNMFSKEVSPLENTYRLCVKKKRFIIYIAPLCVTNAAGVQTRPRPKPAHTDFGLQPYSHT